MGSGGALAIVGGGLLAAQGLHTMWTAKTRTQNVVGGMETGAGIGTMILPGIGTIVGAGIGALAGLIKSYFGVTQKEKEGRAVVGNFQQQTYANLTDAQRQGAQDAVKSGAWTDPTAAGMLIAVRDAYLSIGKTSQQAQDDVKKFWDAEKQGPEATTAAMQPLQEALDQYAQTQKDASAATADQQALMAEGIDKTKAALMALGPDGSAASDQIIDALNRMATQGNITADGIKAAIGNSLDSLGPKGEDVKNLILDQWQEIAASGAVAVSQVSDAFQQLPTDAATAASGAVATLQRQFGNMRLPPIDFPMNVDFRIDQRAYATMPDGGRPVPGFAAGTPGLDFMDFGRESLVRLHGMEAVVAKGDEGAFAAKHGVAGGVGIAGSGSYQSVTILQVDKRELGRAVADALPGELRRLGVRVRS